MRKIRTVDSRSGSLKKNKTARANVIETQTHYSNIDYPTLAAIPLLAISQLNQDH